MNALEYAKFRASVEREYRDNERVRKGTRFGRYTRQLSTGGYTVTGPPGPPEPRDDGWSIPTEAQMNALLFDPRKWCVVVEHDAGNTIVFTDAERSACEARAMTIKAIAFDAYPVRGKTLAPVKALIDSTEHVSISVLRRDHAQSIGAVELQ